MNRFTVRWIACLAGLAAALLLIVVPVFGRFDPFAAGAGLALAAFAVGVSNVRVFLALAALGALLGWMLPHDWNEAVLGAPIALLILFFGVLWWKNPFTATSIRPGLRYHIRGLAHVVPDLKVREPAPRLLRQELLDDLALLGGYADALLTRHGIRYAAGYGTLLGAVRQGGLIPWDDDVDLVFFDGSDQRRFAERFDAMAADAARDGFLLYPFGTYWKLTRDRFWNYPSVDLFCPGLDRMDARTPQRVIWEGGTLCIPPEAEAWLTRKYGPTALTEIVHDLPFWDSGFVPSMIGRLFSYKVKAFADDAYAWVFTVTSK